MSQGLLVAAYAALLAIIIVVANSGTAIAFAWAIGAHLAYLLYVGTSLRRAEATGDPVERSHRFERFRAVASLLMAHDTLALGGLTLATRNTLDLPLVPAVVIGGALGIAGTVCKVWAGRTLGLNGWFWRDFFIAPTPEDARWGGLYRYLDNPMYTVGYVQAWALPMMVRSWHGMIAGLFAHATILVFWWIVERPHARTHYSRV